MVYWRGALLRGRSTWGFQSYNNICFIIPYQYMVNITLGLESRLHNLLSGVSATLIETGAHE